MTRSKDPTAGACASCRKEIPLVPDDQGDLVLREHHVVTSENGYDVVKCPGSRTAAASLDDSKDWAWVPKTGPAKVGEASPCILPSAETTAGLAGLSAAFTRLGTAIATTSNAQDSFTLRPSRMELDGVDITDMIDGPVRIDAEPQDHEAALLAEILTAIRQAYVDLTGEAPADTAVEVRLEQNEGLGPRALALDLPAGAGRISLYVPLRPAIAADPEARAALARRVADNVRNELRLRLGCGARTGLHFCVTREPHQAHRCAVPVCEMTWTNLEAPHGTS